MMRQREQIKHLIDNEVALLADCMNFNRIIAADYQLDRIGGIIFAAYFVDLITEGEYEYLNSACHAIRYGKESLV